MERRAFMVRLTVAALAAPLAAAAQQPATTHRIGVLAVTTSPAGSHLLEAFRRGLRERGYIDGKNIVLEVRWAEGRHDRLPDLASELVRLKVDVIVASAATGQGIVEAFTQGLREFGYVEGRNIRIEYRWADGHYERLPGLAKELVGLNVDVIVSVGGAPSARAVKAATNSIPVVFVTRDPVATGLVASVARPGGNLTGIDVFPAELDAKRLEILKETLPTARQVAVLWNPEDPTAAPQRHRLEDAARALGLRIRVVAARRPEDIDTTFAVLARERPDALLVAADPMFSSERARIVALAARSRLPAAYFWRGFVEAGGLLSYAVNLQQVHRRLAAFVDKILKGAKPADLPVEQPTKFELAINLKTAKALGLTIPPSVLLRADQIVE